MVFRASEVKNNKNHKNNLYNNSHNISSIKRKIKYLGKIVGFEAEEEWTPSTLKEKSRRNFYYLA
jgi:hypothetical protein